MRVARKFVWGMLAAAAMAALTVGCGGSSTAPSGGGGSGGGSGGGGGTSGTTITITASGVSPKTITVVQGTQVTFTNSDAFQFETSSGCCQISRTPAVMMTPLSTR